MSDPSDLSAPAEAGSPRLSPLHEAHLAAGASFTDFAGWQMPVRYTSDLAEHHAVRTAAGLFDLSHMAEIVVLGPAAAQGLDYALAGTPSAQAVGQAKYNLILSASGRVIDDVVVYRTGDDRFLVVANAANREAAADALRERLAGYEANVYDESDDVALLAIQGPLAQQILLDTPGLQVEDGHPDGSDLAGRLGALPYYRLLAGLFLGQPVLIARTGYTGEDGFELYTSPDRAPELWNALLEAGAPRGLVPAGLASRDTLRLEAGMPLYGHEIGLGTYPVQAGLGRVVNLSKTVDFVGRQASEEGPPADAWVLVGLVANGKRAARAGYDIVEDAVGGHPIGIITSGALSPTLGHPVAMGYLGPRHARIGTVVSVDIRGKRLDYTVTELPFYRRKKN